MATNTFDRKIEVESVEGLMKLIQVMEAPAPVIPLSDHPYSESERAESKQLLEQFLFHSK